ncbi:putative disease resistance protein At3g14460 [Vigna unguiculata]|uniref:putative disease resistance protein At3g14460 n=1 Tax=Vigna unguiculata TaxID=3917 RepID=UPI00101627A7|nr:putative disease resistance protein At3g14460 [Vigna unguiculata]
MALEFVGSALLSAFLQVAFEKLASPQILDFFRARKLDEKLLNKLETNLHSIHSLADDAERKQFTDPHVRNWLLKVKDAVLDAEDLLDDLQNLSKSQVDVESESQTFAYCALFPKDYKFEKECLIQLWMTENLLHCQHSRTPEEVGQQYFNDLLSRSFFQQLARNEEVFVMHDLLNDLAKYVGGGIYFMWEFDKTEKIQKVTRHFSVELGYKQHFDGFGKLCNTEKLRTFIMPKGRELPDSIGNLEHLRSLDLSYTPIKKLTETICSLSHLQILKLNYCRDLEELPSDLHLLTNLCRLEFMKTKVRKVPLHLGKLKSLKVMMSPFIVGHSKEFGIHRLGELNLDGSLSIEELQNIENSLDALEADLKNKTNLVKLKLRWDSRRNGNSIDSKKEENVIENLQPSKNLKELSIFSYGGKQLPNWLLENSLRNMMSLVLEECESCQRLPPLGLLPFLKDLRIARIDGIVSIDADFHGNNSSSFKSLETLEFSSMKQWEKWECQVVKGVFPNLQRLYINDCPKLKGELPEQLFPLEILDIRDCQQLDASAPRAVVLRIKDYGKLKINGATLTELSIGGHNKEVWFMEMVGHIVSCSFDLCNACQISDDSVSLWTFPLHFFPTLTMLSLKGFSNLHMISHDQAHNHLQYLTIRDCPKFESLPANMHMLLPSLTMLSIKDCPRLESFPDGGLPPNLCEMRLMNCSRLIGLLKGALGDNPSLKNLWIENVDAECFPDEGLLPFSLTSLIITYSPNLIQLDYKGLYQLSSLETLTLYSCPNLRRLPKEGLPKSVSCLEIDDCPLLEQRCKTGRRLLTFKNCTYCSDDVS